MRAETKIYLCETVRSLRSRKVSEMCLSRRNWRDDMGMLLNKLLKAHRKEQDDKYAQVKNRQGKRKPESEAADAAGGDAGAQATDAAISPGGSMKKMRLVISRPSEEPIGTALPQAPAAPCAATGSSADLEYDL